MAEPSEKRTCASCGALNPPGANRCLKCKAPFTDKKPDVTEEDIDKLLSDIFKGDSLGELKLDAEKGEDLGIDLGKQPETASAAQEPESRPEDLLESLLLDSATDKQSGAEVFECPLCGAPVSVDATECPSCGAPFVDDGKQAQTGPAKDSAPLVSDGELEALLDETVAPLEAEAEVPLQLDEEEGREPEPSFEPPAREAAPPAGPRVAPKEAMPRPPAVDSPRPEPPIVAPSEARKSLEAGRDESATASKEMEVSEPSVPVLSRFGTRLVDISLVISLLLMLVVFLGGRLWIFGNWSALWAALLVGIALVGFLATYALHLFGNSFIVKGDQLYFEGKYTEALQMYEKAVRFGSRTSSSAWTNRGNCYRHIGHMGEALRSHNIALKIDGKDEIAWANKGAVLLLMGDVEGALDAYDRALKLKPNYVVALNNKGVALANADELQNALLHFRRAVEIQPRYRAAWVNLAEGFARLGMGDESERCLSVARQMA